MIHEIAVAGSRFARNNGNAHERTRQNNFLVHVCHAVFCQLRKNFFATAHHISESIRRIYVVYHKRKPVAFVEIHFNVYEYLYSCGECLSGFAFKACFYYIVRSRPDYTVCRGNVLPCCVFFNEFAVEMTVNISSSLAYFRSHPIGLRQSACYCQANACRKFVKRNCVAHQGRAFLYAL